MNAKEAFVNVLRVELGVRVIQGLYLENHSTTDYAKCQIIGRYELGWSH